MTMDRRDFLVAGAAAAAVAALPSAGSAQAAAVFAPKPESWRRFEVTTRLEIAAAQDGAKAWIPLPSVYESDWMRPQGNRWTTNADQAIQYRDAKSGADMLLVQWTAGGAPPVVEIQSWFAARDRAIDLSAPRQHAPLSESDRAFFTAPRTLLPTDGIVKDTALKITEGAQSDLGMARRLYEWIVENTFRDPKTRGCGIGDIASMLKSGTLGGKCADLNALFVGMARSLGLPARDLYGIRVAPSRFGYKSLGANAEIVTKAQHCRAEVYLADFGWVPVDPADVRKVALEEPPGNLPLDNAMVANARKALLGAWEGNWLAYNYAQDVSLPGARDPGVEFLMYPQAETAAGFRDSYDPDNFRYTIKATEIGA